MNQKRAPDDPAAVMRGLSKARRKFLLKVCDVPSHWREEDAAIFVYGSSQWRMVVAMKADGLLQQNTRGVVATPFGREVAALLPGVTP